MKMIGEARRAGHSGRHRDVSRRDTSHLLFCLSRIAVRRALTFLPRVPDP